MNIGKLLKKCYLSFLNEKFKMDEQAYEKTKQVKEKYTSELMSYPNVTGVGVGHKVIAGKEQSYICIRVYVTRKLPKSELIEKDTIPHSIEGIPVDIIESGEFIAL